MREKMTNNIMLWRYKWRLGMINWLFHRISGVALVVYLLMHMFVVRGLKDAAATGSAQAFEQAMSALENPLFELLEIALLAAVLFHAFNGIRVMIVDFFNGAKYYKVLDIALWIVFLAVFIPTGLAMFWAIIVD